MTAVLPDEVVFHIFSYLDPRSLGAALQCSTTFYRIGTSPALWELPYLLRWSTGDPEREEARQTTKWRQSRRIQRLEHHARRASIEKDLAPRSPLASPFRYLRLSSQQPDSEASSSEPSDLAQLDFYRLFVERISIDQEVLDVLYGQVEATHGRIPIITSLAQKFGNDAKDILTAVVEAQSSCPSWTPDGLPPSSSRNEISSEGSGEYRVNAYQAHLPTTLRSDTHHLVILHHAREILEHLQRREAMHKIDELSRMSHDTPEPRLESAIVAGHFVPSDTETAVSLLTLFRGGEVTFVEDQLDVLAAACDLYLQQRFQAPSSAAHGDDGSPTAKEMALAICDFLADHGFRGARDDVFSDLDNHFLHHCFTTNRETLPLSLTLIFCGVANRLGLRASLCNFPMRILAFIMSDPVAPLPRADDSLSSVPHDMFWLDVCEHTTVAYSMHKPTPTDAFARQASWLESRPPILDRDDLTDWIGRMGIPPSDDFWRPASPDSMIQRAARNILSSVQRAQILPRNMQPGGQATSALRTMELTQRLLRLHYQWTNLVRIDHAFLSSFYGRTDAAEHEAITKDVTAVLRGDVAIRLRCLAEDETAWMIVRRWRSESMRSLTTAPHCWAWPAERPAERFRSWMDSRALDHDWTRVRDDVKRRSDHWSEHEQQAAKYAAVNALFRLNTQVSAREVDWIAAFLQSYFMLDVEVIERDFLGIEHAPDRTPVPRADTGIEDDDSEGSESSNEPSFSRQAVDGEGAAGIVQNMSVRVILRRMLQAVRVKDAEPPRVNRRVGAEARRKRAIRGTPSSTARHGAKNDADSASGDATEEMRKEVGEEEEDLIGYRVGTVFRHHTYRYAGCILGWDPHCAAPEDWIVNMGVDRLPPPRSGIASTEARSGERRGGRHQPFYHSQVADGTRRYVAEVNVERLTGPIWIYGDPAATASARGTEATGEATMLATAVHKLLGLRGLGEYFRCFDQQRAMLRRNRDCTVMFPDDWSDDEDDQELRNAPPPQHSYEEEQTERLSEDGSW